MADIKLEWVVEAYPKTKKSIKKLTAIANTLPEWSANYSQKEINKLRKAYVSAFVDFFENIGYKDKLNVYDCYLCNPPPYLPARKISSLSSPKWLVTITNNMMINIDLGKNKSDFDCKDFKRAIEYIVNKLNIGENKTK